MKKRNDQFYDVLLCHVLLCYFVRLFVLVILLRYSRFFDLTNASFLAFSHIRPKLFVFRRTISLQLRIFFFFRYFDNKHIFKSPGFVTQVCTHTQSYSASRLVATILLFANFACINCSSSYICKFWC